MAPSGSTEGTSVDFSATTYATTSTADVFVRLGYVCIQTAESFEQLRKALMKLDRILKMKKQWAPDPLQLSPLPAMRPDIQLRGVRRDGRGWG